MMRAGLTALLFWGFLIASFLVTPCSSVAAEVSLSLSSGTLISDNPTPAPTTSSNSPTRYEPTPSAAGISVAAHPAETSPLSTVNSNAVSFFAFVPQVTNFVLETNWANNIASFIIAHRSDTHHLTVRNNDARTSINTTAQTDILFIADADTVAIEVTT